MHENCHSKENNNFIYYELKTDYIQNEDSQNENDFNLETKKINKERINFKSKIQKKKIFQQFFNCKLKKIKINTKPTPFQKFLKEKEYLKSMNNLRVNQQLNPPRPIMNIISQINKKINLLSEEKSNKNKEYSSLKKNLSSRLYLNKIKNYKKKDYFFDKTKDNLYHYYIKRNKTKEKNIKSYKSDKNINNEKIVNSFRLLELIKPNNKGIKAKDFFQNYIDNNSFFTDVKRIRKYKKNKRNNYTNTVYKSLFKNGNNKNISYKNYNNNYFPNIYKKYNQTENSMQKDKGYILDLFSNIKNKKDFFLNKKSFEIKNKEKLNNKIFNDSKNKIYASLLKNNLRNINLIKKN